MKILLRAVSRLVMWHAHCLEAKTVLKRHTPAKMFRRQGGSRHASSKRAYAHHSMSQHGTEALRLSSQGSSVLDGVGQVPIRGLRLPRAAAAAADARRRRPRCQSCARCAAVRRRGPRRCLGAPSHRGRCVPHRRVCKPFLFDVSFFFRSHSVSPTLRGVST